MSGASPPLRAGFGGRLPPWLAPREREEPGRRRAHRIEAIILILVGLLLSVAVVNDVVLQTHVNHRINADLSTWRHYTHHDYVNISIEQDIYGHTTRDVACGNVSPGPPGERVQICLVLKGPVSHGLRSVRGGWNLQPYTQDLIAHRYHCFGSAVAEGLCHK